MRVRRQARAIEDGFSSPLIPGVHASADAERLADELAFSAGRLAALAGRSAMGSSEDAAAVQPLPGPYAEARALRDTDPEQAIWICWLLAYLCPLEGSEPFAGIDDALAGGREPSNLDGIPLGPRTSYDAARGMATLEAYRNWYGQAGSQAAAFAGDPDWTPERRFERVFERLALPGLTRGARFELLTLLGALGLAALEADSLHLVAKRSAGGDDDTALAAKRLFAIGDQMLLERRARVLAEAIPLPLGALELALANWQAGERRATLGFPEEVADERVRDAARTALGL
ncbi:MAG TPA: hypothetical protein VMB05_03035 [Solirubrobacteraceae bacterium]|nr:hypothetical protein [Solirubrobacteraceae bacterium]